MNRRKRKEFEDKIFAVGFLVLVILIYSVGIPQWKKEDEMIQRNNDSIIAQQNFELERNALREEVRNY